MKKREKIRKIIAPIAFLVWTFSVIIVTQMAVGYLMLAILGEDKFQLPIWTAIYSAITYIIAFLVITLVPTKIFKKWRTSREGLGLKGFPTWTDIGLAPVGYIVSLIAAAGLVALFNLFPWFNADEAQNVGFSTFLMGGDRIIAFITLVIIAPIAEELIFRGWLYGNLRKRLSMPISILLVSVLFGLIHGQWNVGVNVFALSVVLCGLREITGTIYSGILVHILKNAVAFFLIYVIGVL